MNEIIRPGAGVLFMKVGTHAQEDLAAIIARKTKEIEDVGFAMWGYGGNTCHPATMVQPFAQNYADMGQPIHLVMEEMNSRHFAEPKCAKEYSADGREWHEIPEPVQVRGSRFALMIRHLRQVDLELSLDRTEVAIGPQTGRVGNNYVVGQVDKACLTLRSEGDRSNDPKVVRPISLVADIMEPYAVFLRNYR